MQGIVGVVALLAIAWLFSERRRDVAYRHVAVGLAAQIVLAFVLLKVAPVRDALLVLNHVVYAMETATRAGTSLLFGFLGGEPAPFVFVEDNPARTLAPIFAFRILPQILVFSVVVAVLWHLRVLPWVIRAFAWALRRTLGLGGAVGVAAASSVFLGLAEAPLVIRAYLKSLTRSEFFVVVTCCMSTVAGSIMALYAAILADVIDGALGHVLVASVINVVGAATLARIMIPEDGAATGGDIADALRYDGVMDAISRGTADGLRLVANVGAMVLVLVSLVALSNVLLGAVEIVDAPLTLQRAAGWLFAPVAWLMGVPWAEATDAGALLGTKIVLNELIAYLQFAQSGEALSAQSRVILTYALCGFTNLGSVGILLGGLGTLVPERRRELIGLVPRVLLAGTLVSCLTGTLAGLVTRL